MSIRLLKLGCLTRASDSLILSLWSTSFWMQAEPLLASTALISQSRNVPRAMFHCILELLRLRAQCPVLRVSALLPPPLAVLAMDA